ncbi:cell surface glycoprotein CD200 receptor 1-like [Cololabis saira]|uniref:cell surface glycoprotein CD200 receptor 1-like n=1 Tax=Cololabis saira TaxID=129043 RepID=UPI002AD33101|nr:cell surface glycoprotein CD200 receptor 1-like [Cololabis saira]
MIWIYLVTVFLSEAWSLNSGTTDNTSVKPSSPSHLSKVDVNKNAVFNIGSNVNLTCSNKTWSEMIYVIWTINLKHNTCKISFSNDGQNSNSCNDGKSLQNSSSAQSYLHIPNFSAADVGVYMCEAVVRGGMDNYNIDVGITAPPQITAWFETKGNVTVAVCRAERGNPAANISWSHTGNHERADNTVLPDGFVTVESHLELLEGMDPENLTCIVRHQSWREEKRLAPSEERKTASTSWVPPFVGLIMTLLVLIPVVALIKPIMRRCRQTDPSKPLAPEDVEEVEPYASYIQRVNSIYN